MTKRVDPYLSRKAQALWPEACVQCTITRQSKAWSLERPRQALQPIRLGTPFKEVKSGPARDLPRGTRASGIVGTDLTVQVIAAWPTSSSPTGSGSATDSRSCRAISERS
jgi:hypothetical protein